MNAMRHLGKFLVLAVLGAATASCGDVVRSGRAPVFLVIDTLTASQGAAPGTTAPVTNASYLQSDVITNGSIYNDSGLVQLRTSMKDITSTVGPSSNNDVTISRYHVAYRRADGRNTQGVDVPYAFDGAVTGTVPVGGTLSLGFELVRHDAKMEAPLAALATNPQIITTIADVTFYGRDVVGNEINVTGSIQVDFGNFADPKVTQ